MFAGFDRVVSKRADAAQMPGFSGIPPLREGIAYYAIYEIAKACG
jgi:hypothetical protein